jgi:hypothetical protein
MFQSDKIRLKNVTQTNAQLSPPPVSRDRTPWPSAEYHQPGLYEEGRRKQKHTGFIAGEAKLRPLLFGTFFGLSGEITGVATAADDWSLNSSHAPLIGIRSGECKRPVPCDCDRIDEDEEVDAPSWSGVDFGCSLKWPLKIPCDSRHQIYWRTRGTGKNAHVNLSVRP